LKIINEEGDVLIPKNQGDNFSPVFFAHRIFWGGVSRYAATPYIAALSPVHCDITRFHLWLPIATGNHLGRPEIIPTLLRGLAPLTFLIRIQAIRDPLGGELQHVQLFENDGQNRLI